MRGTCTCTSHTHVHVHVVVPVMVTVVCVCTCSDNVLDVHVNGLLNDTDLLSTNNKLVVMYTCMLYVSCTCVYVYIHVHVTCHVRFSIKAAVVANVPTCVHRTQQLLFRHTCSQYEVIAIGAVNMCACVYIHVNTHCQSFIV